MITGPVREAADHHNLAPHLTVESRTTGRQVTALVRPSGPLPSDWRPRSLSLEALILAHLRNPAVPSLALRSPSASVTSQENSA